MPKLQHVIGTKDTVVKVGTKEEYLYWRVIPRATQEDIGKEKQFYLSPQYAPGYDDWSKEPYWIHKIREWENRRNELLGFQVF